MIQQSHYWAYTQRKALFKKTHVPPMFIAALFKIARSWKQPKCPSTDEWIKKLWYIYTMEYYSAIKRIKIGSFVETWMHLETVIQSEVSQKEKNKYRIVMHICGTQKMVQMNWVAEQKLIHRSREKNVWTPRGESSRGWGLLCDELGDWD